MGLAPGAVGGVCNVFVGHPLDLVKVKQQVVPSSTTLQLAGRHASSSSTQCMLRSIFVKDGVSGLYAGVTAPLLAVVPAFALVFATNDRVKALLATTSSDGETAVPLTTAQFALAGGISGVPLALILGPLERIKCEFQVHGASKYQNSIRNCVRHVHRQKTMFRGTGLTMARDVPGNAVYFASYELFRRKICQLQGTDAPSMTATMWAGGLAGMANWAVAIPMDVVKSRFQVAAPGRYSSCWHVLTDLLRHEGPSALFRGLSPALLRAFPANSACFLGAETVRTILMGSYR
jgi:solute carrier family 25 carnitine/acylcarnitine transporter 20/29